MHGAGVGWCITKLGQSRKYEKLIMTFGSRWTRKRFNRFNICFRPLYLLRLLAWKWSKRKLQFLSLLHHWIRAAANLILRQLHSCLKIENWRQQSFNSFTQGELNFLLPTARGLIVNVRFQLLSYVYLPTNYQIILALVKCWLMEQELSWHHIYANKVIIFSMWMFFHSVNRFKI